MRERFLHVSRLTAACLLVAMYAAVGCRQTGCAETGQRQQRRERTGATHATQSSSGAQQEQDNLAITARMIATWLEAIVYHRPDDWEKPERAKKNLIALGDIVIPDVLVLITDERSDSVIRGHAEDILVGIGEASVDPLIKALPDAHPAARSSIAACLTRIGSDRAMAKALDMLENDPDVHVRALIAFSIGKYGMMHQTHMAALIRALEDEDDNVRYMAHYSLKQLTGLDLPQESRAWRQWWLSRSAQPRKDF